jgi:uncharacterized repeat protein (TIGR01451 family)
MSWQGRIKAIGVLLCGGCLVLAALFAPGASTAPGDIADLGVTKTDSPDPVQAGQVLTYRIEAFNQGPQDATGVTATDALPSHVDFVSATSTAGSCKHQGNHVVCDIGKLGADPTRSNSVTVLIKVRPTRPGTITNSVSVKGNEADPVPVNDKAEASTRVTAPPKPSSCRGVAATITGTPGADRLVGTNQSDVIAGLGGGDVILGLAGRDLICSGGGNDRVVGGGAADRIFGGRGADRLLGRGGPDLLAGNPGRDILKGGGGNGRLRGGAAFDRCFGGAGFDRERSCER